MYHPRQVGCWAIYTSITSIFETRNIQRGHYMLVHLAIENKQVCTASSHPPALAAHSSPVQDEDARYELRGVVINYFP